MKKGRLGHKTGKAAKLAFITTLSACLVSCAISNLPIDTEEKPTIRVSTKKSGEKMGKSENCEIEMIRYAGTPEEFGRNFGLKHAERLRKNQDAWLGKAAAKNISPGQLLEMAKPMVDTVRKIAPHWLEEAEAAAEAAGIDKKLYAIRMFYMGQLTSGGRGWFIPQEPDDCTSYVLSGRFADGGYTFFHRTRDNTPGKQSGAIWDINATGVNKFMAVTYTGSTNVSVMVNEKGLAASADMGGPNAKKRKDVGMMNGLMLRYIAEKASNCEEALEIVKLFVEKGWYAGGKPGTKWTFTDMQGKILDASHSSDMDSLTYRYIENKFYITRTRGGSADRMLEKMETPAAFTDFRNISRNPQAKINYGKNSIAGMTIRVHPVYPQYLTSAWFSFPAASLAFPMYMGGTRTPLPLLDGSVYELCASITIDTDTIEKMEEKLNSSAAEMEKQAEQLIKQERVVEARELIDRWTRSVAEEHLLFLKNLFGKHSE
ncbi:MAG TPA: carcinine hydrolase/isopenicillin-N N-acyltransferase family protein [bacterium]|nr:carcinine hydrolase/isopenicillin-N N-acyltransferase family protein [bacterium]